MNFFVKTLLFWFVTFAAVAEPVQQAENSSTTGATTIVTGAITTTSGNRLIAAVGYYNASQTTITVTDSQGNSWTACGTQQYDATLDYGIQLFYATVTSAGSTSRKSGRRAPQKWQFFRMVSGKYPLKCDEDPDLFTRRIEF